MSSQDKLQKAIKVIAQLSIDTASRTFSKLIKAGATIDLERAFIADISEVTRMFSGSEDEVVGAYVDLVGDAPFTFLFFVSAPDSLMLTDLMLRREVGTTKEFDLYAKSAVQEIGNVLASAIVNVFSRDFGIAMKPTPPAVCRDYIGTVFEEYIMKSAGELNELFVMESRFCVVQFDIKCHMFIVPLPGSDEVLQTVLESPNMKEYY